MTCPDVEKCETAKLLTAEIRKKMKISISINVHKM